VMKIDLVLVGPWERLLSEKKLKREHDQFFQDIKKSKLINRMIYSCTQSNLRVDPAYFDIVIYNYPMDVEICNPNIQNQNTNNLIENSRAGIRASDADFVIKVRSDLIIKNLELLVNAIYANPEKFIVDYDIEHSLLIPYYYPDFLVAGRRSNVLKIFEKITEPSDMHTPDKFITLSPIKSLTVTRFSKDICYTEYSIWSNFLFRIAAAPALKSMKDLSLKDLLVSIKFMQNSICFINRRELFSKNEKFILPIRASRFYFDNNSNLSVGYRIYLLLAYHYILYVKRSFALILKKMCRK
jgi:hypothetical protein